MCAFLNVSNPLQANWGWRGASSRSLSLIIFLFIELKKEEHHNQSQKQKSISSIPKSMVVERKVHYSALFTNLVRWHASAVSFTR